MSGKAHKTFLIIVVSYLVLSWRLILRMIYAVPKFERCYILQTVFNIDRGMAVGNERRNRLDDLWKLLQVQVNGNLSLKGSITESLSNINTYLHNIIINFNDFVLIRYHSL